MDASLQVIEIGRLRHAGHLSSHDRSENRKEEVQTSCVSLLTLSTNEMVTFYLPA